MSGIECLLDTNVVIGLLKQHTAAVELIEKHQLNFSQVVISQITRMKLLGYRMKRITFLPLTILLSISIFNHGLL